MATKYVYDQAGRLTCTFVEVADFNDEQGGFKLSNTNQYKYGEGFASSTCASPNDKNQPNDLEVNFIVSRELWPNAYLNIYITEKEFTQVYPDLGPDPVKKWEIDFGNGNTQEGTGRIHAAFGNGNGSFHQQYNSPGTKQIAVKTWDQKDRTKVSRFSFNSQKGPEVARSSIIQNDNSYATTFDIVGKPGSEFSFDLTTFRRGELTLGDNIYKVDTNGANRSVTKKFSAYLPKSGSIMARLKHSGSAGEAAQYEYTQFLITSPYGSAQQSVEDYNY